MKRVLKSQEKSSRKRPLAPSNRSVLRGQRSRFSMIPSFVIRFVLIILVLLLFGCFTSTTQDISEIAGQQSALVIEPEEEFGTGIDDILNIPEDHIPKDAAAIVHHGSVDSGNDLETDSLVSGRSRNSSPLQFSKIGTVSLDNLSRIHNAHGRVLYASDNYGSRAYLTLDPDLQAKAEEILHRFSVPWGAIVAVDPQTGRLLAIASHSLKSGEESRDLAFRAAFPAASLFKVITAAAAVERSGLDAHAQIAYRGGDHVLTLGNYSPDQKRDRRRISFTDALGKSCNPAFARIALNYLSTDILQSYALNFGFNAELSLELPLERSQYSLEGGAYEFARTAAGFGNVKISPIHAAMMMAALANRGTMMKPYIIDRVVDSTERELFAAEPMPLRQVVLSSTATQLLEMMVATTTSGTARKYFNRKKRPVFPGMEVAGKTGTLRGPNPEGIYFWFVGTAPVARPEIAVAAMVIDPGNARIGGSGLAMHFLEYYFKEWQGSSVKSVNL